MQQQNSINSSARVCYDLSATTNPPQDPDNVYVHLCRVLHPPQSIRRKIRVMRPCVVMAFLPHEDPGALTSHPNLHVHLPRFVLPTYPQI